MDFFSLSDPICTLKTKEANLLHSTWRFNGETEVIDNNLNPKWIKHFRVWFIFVRDVDLWFQVWHYKDPENRDLIGEVEMSLSQLVMAKGQQLTLTLSLPETKGKNGKKVKAKPNRGKLII